MRFKLTIEYNGASFKGWQKNKNEITVQGKLIEACQNIFKTDDVELYGAGRTDAGVHAISQCAHLEVKTSHNINTIKSKLNEKLPSAIQILKCEAVDERFHARHHAKHRSYIYIISKRPSAFFKRNIWWVKEDLNTEKIKEASQEFIGLHNFQSFGRLLKKQESTDVNIEHINVFEKGECIMIQIVGSHFLRSQVRRMVGVLVEIGKGKLSKTDIKKYLEEYSERPSQLTASASGLYLEKVYYNEEKVNLNPEWPVVVW